LRIQLATISSLEKAVGGNGFLGGFFILVISHHGAGAVKRENVGGIENVLVSASQ
jgi:hypothetical protein